MKEICFLKLNRWILHIKELMVPSVPYLQAQWQLSLSGYLSEFYNIPQFWMWCLWWHFRIGPNFLRWVYSCGQLHSVIMGVIILVFSWFLCIFLYLETNRTKQEVGPQVWIYFGVSLIHIMVKSINKGSNLNIKMAVYLHQMLMLAFNNFHA